MHESTVMLKEFILHTFNPFPGGMKLSWADSFFHYRKGWWLYYFHPAWVLMLYTPQICSITCTENDQENIPGNMRTQYTEVISVSTPVQKGP